MRPALHELCMYCKFRTLSFLELYVQVINRQFLRTVTKWHYIAEMSALKQNRTFGTRAIFVQVSSILKAIMYGN